MGSDSALSGPYDLSVPTFERLMLICSNTTTCAFPMQVCLSYSRHTFSRSSSITITHIMLLVSHLDAHGSPSYNTHRTMPRINIGFTHVGACHSGCLQVTFLCTVRDQIEARVLCSISRSSGDGPDEGCFALAARGEESGLRMLIVTTRSFAHHAAFVGRPAPKHPGDPSSRHTGARSGEHVRNVCY